MQGLTWTASEFDDYGILTSFHHVSEPQQTLLVQALVCMSFK